VGLLGLAIVGIGDPSRTEAFAQVIRWWTLVLGVDAVITLSYTVRPRSPDVVGRRG